VNSKWRSLAAGREVLTSKSKLGKDVKGKERGVSLRNGKQRPGRKGPLIFPSLRGPEEPSRKESQSFAQSSRKDIKNFHSEKKETKEKTLGGETERGRGAEFFYQGN